MNVIHQVLRDTVLVWGIFLLTSTTANAAAFFSLDEANNFYTISSGGDPFFAPGRTVSKWAAAEAANLTYAVDPVFNSSASSTIESALAQWSATNPGLGFTPATVAAIS